MKLVLCTLISFFLFALPATQKKKVLIIGDSISIGYFPFVGTALTQEADVVHNRGNAQHTGTGLDSLGAWLEGGPWDVIYFNWGLWDLCYRNPASPNQGHRDKVKGKVEFTPEQYQHNLDSIVAALKQTGARLIFATTTVVPPDELGRKEGDEKAYNKAALAVMKKYKVTISDLNAVSYDLHQRYAAGEGNVHYTPEGYQKLSYTVVKAISSALHAK